MDGDGRLAGQPEGGGQRDGHDIPHIAHVVVGNPLPETKERLADDRFGIEDGEDVLDTVMGHLFVETAHYGGVEFAGAELNHDPLADLDVVVVLLWHTVGVGAVDVKGEYDISVVCDHVGVLNFLECKNTTFF